MKTVTGREIGLIGVAMYDDRMTPVILCKEGDLYTGLIAGSASFDDDICYFDVDWAKDEEELPDIPWTHILQAVNQLKEENDDVPELGIFILHPTGTPDEYDIEIIDVEDTDGMTGDICTISATEDEIDEGSAEYFEILNTILEESKEYIVNQTGINEE